MRAKQKPKLNPNAVVLLSILWAALWGGVAVALVAVDDSRVPWWCLSVAFLGTCNALANVPKCGRAR